jgi:pimeloyl-ACP methyl ester carboxylesterase
MRLSLQKYDQRAERKTPDLLFIHGTGSAGEMWKGQVDYFTGLGYRCYVIDLRGHGLSEEPEEFTDLEVHLSDVLETLENSDIEFPAAFVGHSLGAIISVSLAGRRPELFAAILAAALPGRVFKPISYVFKLFMNHTYEPIRKRKLHEGWRWRERTLLNTNRHALEQIMANFSDIDFVSKMPELPCTLHMAAGRFDPVAPCHYTQKIHKQMPNSTLKVFTMGGHNFMDTFPDDFNQWILKGLP